jgi:hypothetical protein
MPSTSCRCCQENIPVERPRICPECEHIFKGNGWDGIDAHWRAKHEQAMPYEVFWDGLCVEHRSGPPKQTETSGIPSFTSPATKYDERSQNPVTDSALKQGTTAHSEVPRIFAITQSGDELDYRISSSYPLPVAYGFRSLTSIVDHRDLYREQLRIAENILVLHHYDPAG